MNSKERINDYVGMRIMEVRLAYRYTQEELAQVLGLTRTSVINMEQGRQVVSLFYLYKIAHHFGEPLENFLPPVEDIFRDVPDEVSTQLVKAKKDIQDLYKKFDDL